MINIKLVYLATINSTYIHYFLSWHSKGIFKTFLEELDLLTIGWYNCNLVTRLQCRIKWNKFLIQEENKVNFLNIYPWATPRWPSLFSLMNVKEAEGAKAAVIMPCVYCPWFDFIPIFQGVFIKLSRGKASYLFDHNMIKPTKKNWQEIQKEDKSNRRKEHKCWEKTHISSCTMMKEHTIKLRRQHHKE